MKTYHTVVRLEKVKDHVVKVKYLRQEDTYYESAEFYEKFYTEGYCYPDVISAVVVNQFVTEESDEGE